MSEERYTSGEKINDINYEMLEDINFEVINEVNYEALKIQLQEELDVKREEAKVKDAKKTYNIFAIAALITGVFTVLSEVLLCCYVYGFVISIIASILGLTGTILGIIALRKGGNKIFSILGISFSVLGIIVVVFYYLCIFGIVSLVFIEQLQLQQ